MRWWMGLSSSFAEVVMMAHVGIRLPSGSFHIDHMPAKANGLSRPQGDMHGALAGPRALPLVEAVGEHEAAPTSEGIAERGLFGDHLGPGVDHAAADGAVLGPEGNESPAHEPGASWIVTDNGEDVLRGSDVVAASSVS